MMSLQRIWSILPAVRLLTKKRFMEALKNKVIRGAALDVFENEPALASGTRGVDNIVLTPHAASATEETRGEMAKLAAKNIIEVLEGGKPVTPVY